MCCLLGLVLVIAACDKSGGVTPADRQLTIGEAAKYAYDAGFRTEAQLVDVVAIAVSESSLRTLARKWHPEYGYRPTYDEIGVEGPSSAWNAAHTQQVHSDRGLWQISSRAWPQYADIQTDDPAEAARLVWIISKHGTYFGLWDSYKTGMVQKHATSAYDGWPAIQPIVHNFLASM